MKETFGEGFVEDESGGQFSRQELPKLCVKVRVNGPSWREF